MLAESDRLCKSNTQLHMEMLSPKSLVKEFVGQDCFKGRTIIHEKDSYVFFVFLCSICSDAA